ncbi:MAG: 5-formyltetrahydrofolate cyclo-ligase [Clostridia bacterium]|nr:5-formyltetrahydrofolate cyclo-ligase [Clostridia bacterium]
MPLTTCAALCLPTDMNTEKKAIRQEIRSKRDAIPQEKKKELDRAILQKIASMPQFRSAKAILCYAPIGSEINLLPLVRLAQSQGKTVAFPKCDPDTEEMQFFSLLQGQKLIRGAYSIPEPPQDAPLFTPDEHTLCILPALACDRFGNRLGYGKGYYDKFLKDFRGSTVCAVYGAFLADTLPVEDHDVPVQWICTERALMRADTEKEKASKGEARIDLPTRAKELWKALLASFRKTDGASPLHQPPVLVLSTFVLLLLSGLLQPYLDRDSRYAGVAILQILIFLIPAIVYTKLRGESFLSHLRLRLPRLSQLWFLVCVLVVMITGGLLCEILTGGISSLSDDFLLYERFSAQPTASVGANVAILIAYAILPAFCEELVFRSVLCAEYEGRGVGVSMLASALFFAMLHFSLPHFFTYFVLGLLLSGAFYATRSFPAVFALHLAYNVFCLFGQPYLSAFYVSAGSTPIFIFCLITLCLLFSAFAAGEARKIYHLYAKAGADSSYTVSLPIASLPMALFSALRSWATLACILLFFVFSIIHLFS